MSIKVVTLGEVMMTMPTRPVCPLHSANTLACTIAGTESNRSHGLGRLDRRSGWVGRLGCDALGGGALAQLRRQRVGASQARVDEHAPIGPLIRDRRLERGAPVLSCRTGPVRTRFAVDNGDKGSIHGVRGLRPRRHSRLRPRMPRGGALEPHLPG